MCRCALEGNAFPLSLCANAVLSGEARIFYDVFVSRRCCLSFALIELLAQHDTPAVYV